MKSITHNNWLNFIWFFSNVSRKYQKWYFQDNHEVYCWERLEKRAIWFIAKFKLGLTLCSIVGKISSKTGERYYVVKSSRLIVKYYFVTLLKQHLLPECQRVLVVRNFVLRNFDGMFLNECYKSSSHSEIRDRYFDVSWL